MGISGTVRSSKSQGRRFWKSVCLQLVFLLVFSSLWCSIDGAAYPSFPATKPKLVNGGFTPISSSKGSWDGETPQPQARLKELVEETTDSESALPSLTNDEAFGRTDFQLSSLMEGQDSVPPAISFSTTSGDLDLSAGTDTSESRYGDKRSSHSFFYNSNAMRPVNEPFITLHYVGMVPAVSPQNSSKLLQERFFEVKNLSNDSIDASNEQLHRFKRTAELEAIRKRMKICGDLETSRISMSIGSNLLDPIVGFLSGTWAIVGKIIGGVITVAGSSLEMTKHQLGCGSVDFDEIKEIMKQNHRDVTEKLHKNFLGIQENFQSINRNYHAISEVGVKVDRNFIAINHVGDRVDRNLMVIIEGFSKVGTRFDTVEKSITDGINQVVGFIKETSVQSLISELLRHLRYLATEADSLRYLREKELVSKFKKDLLKNLEEVRTPQSLDGLLHKLIDQKFVIPENKNHKSAFLALDFLCAGTKAYVEVMGLLRNSYNYLAHYYYKQNDIDQFNEYFSQSTGVLLNFKSSLIGSQGLILEVIEVLKKVKRLSFVDDYRSGKMDFLVGQIELFSTIQSNIDAIAPPPKAPEKRINIHISDSNLNTPIGKWKREREVRYAMQQFSSGKWYTPVGKWSSPFTVANRAAPSINIGSARNGISRKIFRKFDSDPPELVSIIEDSSQTVFRDISRDLYNAASELNTGLALDAITTLLENGADIHARFEEGNQAIHAAARSGNFTIMQMLLKHDADVGAVDLRSYTPLHVAVEAGHETLSKEIMKYTHASVNAKSASGWTPLHVAVEKSFLRCITALLEREDIDVNAEAINGFTPLHLAASDGLSDSANLLLNDPRTDVNAESDTGLTPLHLASLGDHGSTVRLLLSNKRSRKVKSKAGLLPLHFAASAGHVNIVKMLMEHDLDNINVKSLDGFTPLHLALSMKHKEAALELLSSDGMEVNLQNKGGLTALHLAAVGDQELDIVKRLVEKGANLNIRDTNGYTALDLVSRSNPSSPIKKYLAEIILEKVNTSGRLIDQIHLHWAVSNNHLGVVQYLVEEKGGNVNERESCFGNAPLHLAVKRNSLDLVKYLLEKGADANLKRKDGKTAYDLAKSLNDSAVAKYLADTNGESVTKTATKKVPGLTRPIDQRKRSNAYVGVLVKNRGGKTKVG